VSTAQDQHRVPHDLPLPVARMATRAALDSYRARFAHLGPDGRWLDDDNVELSFVLRGRRVDARLRVEPDAIVISLSLPRLFRPFRRRAVAVIEQEVRRWVERARRGELDAGE